MYIAEMKLHLAVLEAIRGAILGHAVSLTHPVVMGIDADSPEALLVRYAALLREALQAEIDNWPTWYASGPRPVLPRIDLIGLRVDLVSCTGQTHLTLDVDRGLTVSKLDGHDNDRAKGLLLCSLADAHTAHSLGRTLPEREVLDIISRQYNQSVGASADTDWEPTKPNLVDQAQFVSDVLIATYFPERHTSMPYRRADGAREAKDLRRWLVPYSYRMTGAIEVAAGCLEDRPGQGQGDPGRARFHLQPWGELR